MVIKSNHQRQTLYLLKYLWYIILGQFVYSYPTNITLACLTRDGHYIKACCFALYLFSQWAYAISLSSVRGIRSTIHMVYPDIVQEQMKHSLIQKFNLLQSGIM